MDDFRIRSRMVGATLLGILLLWLADGCTIEETTPPETGSLLVTLTDTSGSEVTGARISLDGRITPRFTPATLTGVTIGVHTVSAFKPGFVETPADVEVRLNETSVANLSTYTVEGGSVELLGVPDGTVLLLDHLSVGTVPVTPEHPAVFERLGIGTYRASAYLPGHATELPASWSVQLDVGVTVPLTPLFAPLPERPQVGSLAPAFELPCDWDSALYRIQDYRGQVVLVTFFFANCTACIEEFPHIAAAYQDPAWSGRVQFLGVDFVDSYANFRRFRDEHPSLGITFPLLHDARQTVRSAYGVTVCPANFIVDATGRLRLVTSGISEPQLRQTIRQLLEQASGATFSFTMRDTLIEYSDGNQPFVFHGRLENLLNAPRTFVFRLDPLVCPDTSRQFSICTWEGCDAPRSGVILLQKPYTPLQVDTTIACYIYNVVSDWSGGFPMPVDSSISGDYSLRFSIYPADNTAERIEHVLRLDDVRGSAVAARWPDNKFDRVRSNQ